MDFRKVRFAAPIFHIRWRLARNRFASHACRSWRFTASACELDVVEEPSCHYNDNFRIFDGITILLGTTGCALAMLGRVYGQPMLACLGGSAWNLHRAKSAPTPERLFINHRNF